MENAHAGDTGLVFVKRADHTALLRQLKHLRAQGMQTQRIAVTLGVSRWMVQRMARDNGIALERGPRNAAGKPTIRSHQEWLQLYEEHGPLLKDIAAAVGLNRTYVAWQLWKHGIREMPDKWVDEQDEEEVA